MSEKVTVKNFIPFRRQTNLYISIFLVMKAAKLKFCLGFDHKDYYKKISEVDNHTTIQHKHHFTFFIQDQLGTDRGEIQSLS